MPSPIPTIAAIRGATSIAPIITAGLLRNNPKAAIRVPILDDSVPGAVEALRSTLNKQAIAAGLPAIEPAIYALERRKDDMPQDVKDFFKAVTDGKVVDNLERSKTRSNTLLLHFVGSM